MRAGPLLLLLLLAGLPAPASDPYDPDTDADGVPDSADACRTVADPAQADADADATGDACDCAPSRPGVSAVPGPVGDTLVLSGTAPTELDWGAVPQGHLSRAYRGRRGPGGPWSWNEACLAPEGPLPHASDSEAPAPGELFWYVAAAANGCGEGPTGTGRPPASPCPPAGADADADGVEDAWDLCALAADPGQADADRDHRGDACDPCLLDPGNDADGDGICARTRGPAVPWRESTVYVLIPDKYQDGDPTNNFMKDEFDLPNPAWEGGYRGGDLQGVLDRIDHLRSLGVDTVLMYPPFANDRQPFFQYLAGGYRVTDWQEVDRNLGSKAQLREVVDAFHTGTPPLRVVLDVPIGMAGREHPWTAEPMAHVDHFRPWGTENVGSEPMPMPYGPVDNTWGMGINHHLLGRAGHEAVYGTLLDGTMLWVVREYGVDGLRHDSAQLFHADFWSYALNEFRRDTRSFRPDVIQFGEHLWLDTPLSWQRTDPEFVNAASPSRIRMDGIYDFAMIGDIRATFGRSANSSLLVWNHDAKAGSYDDPKVLAASVDNYEEGFLAQVTDGNGKARLRLALQFLLTLDRVPLLYSGNEKAVDYSAPGTLFADGQDEAFFAWFKDLVRIRRDHPAARRGSFAWLTNTPSYLSFGRMEGADRLVTALNITAQTDRTLALPIGAIGMTCASVRNLLDPSDTRNRLSGSGPAQTLSVTHGAWEGKVLLCE